MSQVYKTEWSLFCHFLWFVLHSCGLLLEERTLPGHSLKCHHNAFDKKTPHQIKQNNSEVKERPSTKLTCYSHLKNCVAGMDYKATSHCSHQYRVLYVQGPSCQQLSWLQSGPTTVLTSVGYNILLHGRQALAWPKAECWSADREPQPTCWDMNHYSSNAGVPLLPSHYGVGGEELPARLPWAEIANSARPQQN